MILRNASARAGLSDILQSPATVPSLFWNSLEDVSSHTSALLNCVSNCLAPLSDLRTAFVYPRAEIGSRPPGTQEYSVLSTSLFLIARHSDQTSWFSGRGFVSRGVGHQKLILVSTTTWSRKPLYDSKSPKCQWRIPLLLLGGCEIF
ncbi:hypothetical protein FIBSPDRAFT_117661 [Athelia psychrophila]|uniref:Uncharacterized protein n=1 Tax=Athelia psychrophila TaxID=1759441 RepID=A0A166CUW8_9AGAM|nr:hypothetical protein FIBSPDRAFT_117661 [Fibularhizoctonia sp. CBS 109695]